MKIELPVINQRSDRAYDPLLAYIFEPLKSRDRIHILKAVLDMEYDIDVFVYSGIIRDYFPVHENILSFDWIIRFQNYKTPDGKPTVRSEDSNSHLQEMKEYLESKRCLVRVMDDPKGEFILLMFRTPF